MLDKILLFIGAALPALWGISHLFPTRSVVRGFGGLSDDNRNIITMEWIIEGVALVFNGLLVAVITIVDYQSPVSQAAFIVTAVNLITLAVVSIFTGYRINFLPFKLCPVIFTTSAALIVIGGVL